MIIINKPIFHPELESGRSIIIKREQLEQHALIVENLEEQLKIAVVNEVMDENEQTIKNVSVFEVDVLEVKEGSIQIKLPKADIPKSKIKELYKNFKEMSELLCDQEHMMANLQNINDQDDIDSRHQARMEEIIELLREELW